MEEAGERSYDPAPSNSCQFNDAGELQCVNVEETFTLKNADTICWQGQGGGWLFALPFGGVCPPQYNGPIGLNVLPARMFTVCQLAQSFTLWPGPCAGECIDRGVQASNQADAAGCTAKKERICDEP